MIFGGGAQSKGEETPSSRGEVTEFKDLTEEAIRETREGLEVLVEYGRELFVTLHEILDEEGE